MKEVDYHIVLVPDRIEFECPICVMDNDIEYTEFVEMHVDEHAVWSGKNGIVVLCGYCGNEIELVDRLID